MLSVEAWTGDLRHFRMQSWCEDDTDVAAVVVVHQGEAMLWVNLVHVHPSQSRLVWLWARRSAKRRGPVNVLFSSALVTVSTALGITL